MADDRAPKQHSVAWIYFLVVFFGLIRIYIRLSWFFFFISFRIVIMKNGLLKEAWKLYGQSFKMYFTQRLQTKNKIEKRKALHVPTHDTWILRKLRANKNVTKMFSFSGIGSIIFRQKKNGRKWKIVHSHRLIIM